MDLPEHIRMDNVTDNLTPNSISYSSARMTSRSSGPMKSLNFPPYSNSSKEWEYAARFTLNLPSRVTLVWRGSLVSEMPAEVPFLSSNYGSYDEVCP
ncbi:hypothetical protein AVEN_41782-1 [Araneus ventricosus]|uniref:Uncharacterized protein n=1 Tax=Araneus ventricosus TaxID=182803 RepID=A0A4Y2ABX6_ARAVE|nr:hypothetical protein AVEN_41782-1 [Araneus ventricosus]